MPKRVFQQAAIIVAIAAAGCAQYPGMPSSTALLGRPIDSAGRPMALTSMPGLTVSGIVMAPAGVISAGGANVISAGGANVVSAGGGNVISAGGANMVGGRSVLSLSEEKPVSGAVVYLADMAGKPLAGTEQAVSDGQGRYAFHQVPPNVAYMVVVTFRTPKGDATLRSLGVSGQGTGEQVVSVASTLVTVAVTQAGATHIAPDAFRAATEAVAADLRDDTLPDLTQPAEVAAKAQAIATTVAPVRQAIDQSQAQAKATAPATTTAPAAPPAPPAAPSSSAGPNGSSYTPVDAGVPAPASGEGTGSSEVPAAPESDETETDSNASSGQTGTMPATPEATTGTQPSNGQASSETTNPAGSTTTTQPPGQGNGNGNGNANGQPNGNGQANGTAPGNGQANGNGQAAGNGQGNGNGKAKDKDTVPPGQAKKDK